MENIFLILPNQLYENNKLINKSSKVYIYEHPIYFTKYNYHKLKLIYHRSSMKSYVDYLDKKYKCRVTYLNFDFKIEDLFKRHANNQIDMYDPVDFDVIKSIKKSSKMHNVSIFLHDNPLYLCKMKDLIDYLDQGGKYHQTSFYLWQRKRLNILMTDDGKPLNGKWTFDKDNRLPFPKKFKMNSKLKQINNEYIDEAQKYVNMHFKNNPGEIQLYLPIDHKGAKKHLRQFIREKLNCFGPYQDAVSKDIIFGCHSVLAPIMNLGLLTHEYVINEVLKYYYKHKSIKLASVEGFIRQIIGWANYMRFIYLFKHKELINANHFNHKHKLTKEWYTGNTGIEPIDDLIKKVLTYGYAHHIERLMYLGNFMLLNEFSPKDIHDWFMSLFLDSYHVFMETNVYGMSQYAAGPLLSTRPYFSSSNYINKMSSYKTVKDKFKKIKLKDKEYEWYEIWDDY